MKIPIFPLNGAIMFPNTNLPLNIFEERYIDMVDYTLSKNKIIGMIQHKTNNELYEIGCYGKITAFNETFFSTFVTIGKGFAPSSISLIFVEAAIKLFSIMIRE